jgi:hypothetical protein
MMKNPVFRALYLVYLGIIFIGCLVLLGLLWKKLTVYQTEYDEKQRLEAVMEQLEQAPQKAFEQYMDGFDIETLATEWIDTHETYDSLNTAKKYFDDKYRMCDEGFTCFKAADYTDKAPAYEIYLGDEKVARIGLTGSGLKWDAELTEVFAKGEYSVTEDVPDGYKVMCNGKELSEDCMEKSGIVRFPYDNERETSGYDSCLTDEITWNLYKVEGLLTEPEVVIYTADDAKVTDGDFIAVDGSDEAFVVIHADNKTASKLQTDAQGFLNAYLTYYVYGRNHIDDHIAAAQSYCFAKSPADKSLINAYEDSVGWAYGHTDLRNEVLEVGMPVMWAKNCCSIDIKYHAYAKRGGEELDYSRKDEMIRIVFVDKGKGYKVYAFDVSPKNSYL